MKTSQLLLLSLAFSLLVLPYFVSAAEYTIGGEGLAGTISKISGVPYEFLTDYNKLLYFLLLPWVAFAVIIFGVLEEIGLFRTRPAVHTVLAVIFATMLLPTGVFGQVALFLMSFGAFGTVLAVMAVFFLGLSWWVRKKTGEYGYSGIFSGDKGYWISGGSLGLIGVLVGYSMGDAGMVIGGIGGFIIGLAWMWIDKRRGAISMASIIYAEKTVDQLIKLRDKLINNREALMKKLPSATKSAQQTIKKEVDSIQDEIDHISTQIRMQGEKI